MFERSNMDDLQTPMPNCMKRRDDPDSACNLQRVQEERYANTPNFIPMSSDKKDESIRSIERSGRPLLL